jgi:transcriptional regulator with XRE-family HTH domain
MLAPFRPIVGLVVQGFVAHLRWRLTVPKPIPGYPATLDHIGHHLRRRRLDLGLCQKEAAHRLGVHPGGLGNWEHGRTTPADRFMPTVIRFLGYNPSPRPITMGQRVAFARAARGWSRKRLAVIASVDEATVRRIEDDTRHLARRPVLAVLTALRTAPHCSAPIVQAPRSAPARSRAGSRPSERELGLALVRRPSPVAVVPGSDRNAQPGSRIRRGPGFVDENFFDHVDFD